MAGGTVGLTGVVSDAGVEVESTGDDDLDTLRNLVARLELPLYRLSTRVTSLDEVFLHRSEGSA